MRHWSLTFKDETGRGVVLCAARRAHTSRSSSDQSEMGTSQSAPIQITSGSVIDVRNSNMTFHALVQAISNSLDVRGVALLVGPMNLTESAMRAFCRTMQQNPALFDKLFIHNSRIPASTFLSFSMCIRSLISLDLDNVGMNETGISAIGRQLPCAHRLKKVAINNDKATLQHANFLTFIEGVVDSNVIELQLCDNGIPDLEAAKMCRLLPQSKLESLSLDGNEIAVWGARAISDGLSQPGAKLRTITLSRNRICVDGAAALSSMIVQNMNLRELDLTANPITNAGVERISSSLEVNITLSVLKLPLAESQSLSEMSRLRQVLQRNRNFQESSTNQTSLESNSAVAG